MRKERICALAALVAVAMVSEPVLARGGGRGGSHGGGHHSSHSSYSHSSSGGSHSSSKSSSTAGRETAKVVKAVAKAATPKPAKQKAAINSSPTPANQDDVTPVPARATG